MSEVIDRKESKENLIRVVGAVIFNEKRDKVLIGQRSKTASHPLKWEFIGGKIKPGESPEEALRREVKEEIKVEIQVGRLLGIAEADYRDLGSSSHQFLFYESKILNGAIKLNSKIHQDLKWVKIEDLPNLDWIENDREFARKLTESLTSPVRSAN